jgi:N-acetylglucosamine kinase-like BadF-type ATPase
MDLDTAGAYDLATDVMAETSQSMDGQEAITSFVEKRRPEFGA